MIEHLRCESCEEKLYDPYTKIGACHDCINCFYGPDKRKRLKRKLFWLMFDKAFFYAFIGSGFLLMILMIVTGAIKLINYFH